MLQSLQRLVPMALCMSDRTTTICMPLIATKEPPRVQRVAIFLHFYRQSGVVNQRWAQNEAFSTLEMLVLRNPSPCPAAFCHHRSSCTAPRSHRWRYHQLGDPVEDRGEQLPCNRYFGQLIRAANVQDADYFAHLSWFDFMWYGRVTRQRQVRSAMVIPVEVRRQPRRFNSGSDTKQQHLPFLPETNSSWLKSDSVSSSSVQLWHGLPQTPARPTLCGIADPLKRFRGWRRGNRVGYWTQLNCLQNRARRCAAARAPG